MDEADDSIVRIVHGAIPNGNTMPGKGGWLPQVWLDGRERHSTWAERSLDKDEAEAVARERAVELAGRFLGRDWKISITKAI